MVLKGLEKGVEELEIEDVSRSSKLQHCVIGQNSEKSCEDLGRLMVTQIPLKEHQLTMV